MSQRVFLGSMIVYMTLGLAVNACDQGNADQDAAPEAKAENPSHDAESAMPSKAMPSEDEPNMGGEKGSDVAPEAEMSADSKPTGDEPANAESKDESDAASENEPAAQENGEEDAAAPEPPESDKPEGDNKNEAKPTSTSKASAESRAKSDADEDKKPAKPKPTAKKTAPVAEPKVSLEEGKAIYLKKCKSCHGVTGTADTKIGKANDMQSFKTAGWKSKWTQTKIEAIVKNGKSGTKMKSFKSKLSADEIEAVSAYTRSLGH